jgi:hypothetical protein
LIERPLFLAGTPDGVVRLFEMDVLSEGLKVVRLEGAFFFNAEFSGEGRKIMRIHLSALQASDAFVVRVPGLAAGATLLRASGADSFTNF